MAPMARAATIVGGLLLSASFFLPWRFHNAPVAWFVWAAGGLDFASAPVTSLVFLAAAAGVACPFAWALLLSVLQWRAGWPERRWAQRSAAVGYAAGMALLAVVGLAEIVARDTFVPPAAQVATAGVGLALAAVMIATHLATTPARRLHLCTLAGSVPLLLLNLGLAGFLCRWTAVSWGYLAGALGALLLAAGALLGLRRA